MKIFKSKQVWFRFLILTVLLLAMPNNGHANSAKADVKLQTVEIQIAATAENDDDDVNDPLETVNRAIFEFNEVFLSAILRPVAVFYNDTLPAGLRTGISNFLTNLSTPLTAVNQVLQGEPDEALRSVGRFLTNSVVGIGGLADVTSELGAPGRDEDFGQTLGVWGIDEGFYLVLPIFGPSNPRDLVGKFLVDPHLNATGRLMSDIDNQALDWTMTGVDGVSEYAGVVEELDQIRKTSVDYYAAIRSLYRQKRKSEISNGEQLELPPIPDLGYNIELEDTSGPIAGTN